MFRSIATLLSITLGNARARSKLVSQYLLDVRRPGRTAPIYILAMRCSHALLASGIREYFTARRTCMPIKRRNYGSAQSRLKHHNDDTKMDNKERKGIFRHRRRCKGSCGHFPVSLWVQQSRFRCPRTLQAVFTNLKVTKGLFNALTGVSKLLLIGTYLIQRCSACMMALGLRNRVLDSSQFRVQLVRQPV